MNLKYIIINGYPRSGKDTFTNMCRSILGIDKTISLSTIDPIKAVARQLGWRGEKTPESRRFLSQLKDLSVQYNDFPYHYIIISSIAIRENRIHELKDNDVVYVFIHCREPQEIQKFVDRDNAFTVLIERPIDETQLSNHSDSKVYEFDYDYAVQNTGSIEDLKDEAKRFCDIIKKEI